MSEGWGTMTMTRMARRRNFVLLITVVPYSRERGGEGASELLLFVAVAHETDGFFFMIRFPKEDIL